MCTLSQLSWKLSQLFYEATPLRPPKMPNQETRDAEVYMKKQTAVVSSWTQQRRSSLA